MCDVSGGGVDYDSGPYTVNILARQTEAMLSVSIINDNTLEEDENFGLSIIKSSLPSRVTVDDLDKATVNILDDDGK